MNSPVESTADSSGFGARERMAIWLLLASAFTVMFNETIMVVALPRLMDDLDITAAAAQWLTTAFLLTMSVVIPITGMLIRRYRTRVLYIAAMGLFTAGTLIAGVAPGFAVLLIGRVVQASGTAIMMPLLMTTVATLVPPQLRGQLMGRIAVVMSVAPALGPTVSGLILQWLSWRWLFFIVLPIAVVALVLGIVRLPDVGETRRTVIDPLSVLLSVIGFGGLVYGLSAVGERATGGETIPPAIPALLGTVAVAWFIVRQLRLQREDRALLDLRTFTVRPYAWSVVLLFCTSIALFGSLIILLIFVQRVLGFSTLESGLVLLPGGLLMAALGPLVGRLVDRRGARFVLLPGIVLTAGALWSMVLFDTQTAFWQVLLTHMLLSVGLAGVFTPVFAVALGSLPMHLASYGSATIATVQQVAGAAGTALFVTIMTLVTSTVLDVRAAVALSYGTNAAFVAGGVAAAVGVVVAFFISEGDGAATATETRAADAD